jgi:hypothetical protein
MLLFKIINRIKIIEAYITEYFQIPDAGEGAVRREESVCEGVR